MTRPDSPPVSCMYYLAILCPDPIHTTIQAYKKWMKEHTGAVAAMKSPAHITIIPPFWWREEQENFLKEILEQFEFPVEEMHLHLNGFSHFGQRVLFVQVENHPGLAALFEKASLYFSSRLGKAYKTDKRPFHPHVTIATRDIRPGGFALAWDYFSSKNFTAAFTANTLSLLKLTQGRWVSIAEKKGSIR